MNPKHTTRLNVSLFMTAIVVATGIFSGRYQLPGPPPLDELDSTVNIHLAQNGKPPTAGPVLHPGVGGINFAAPLIPLPSPAPEPTPAPEIGPRLDDVIANWKLQAVLTRIAIVEDIKSRAVVQLKIGETKTVTFQNKNYDVKLQSIDKKKWSATLSMDATGEMQRKTFSVF